MTLWPRRRIDAEDFSRTSGNMIRANGERFLAEPISLDAAEEIALITPSDGVFIVGNGSEWVGESGATARTSLGLGSGDSPTFGGLTLDTTGTTTQLAIDADSGQISRLMFMKGGANHWRIDRDASDNLVITQSGVSDFLSVAAGAAGIATISRPLVCSSTFKIGSVQLNPASPATNDLLAYNGTSFAPKSPSYGYIHGSSASGPYTQDIDTAAQQTAFQASTVTAQVLSNITLQTHLAKSFSSVTSGTGAVIRITFGSDHAFALGDWVSYHGAVYNGVGQIDALSHAGPYWIEIDGTTYSATDTGYVFRPLGLKTPNAGVYRVSFVGAVRSTGATAYALFLQFLVNGTQLGADAYVKAPVSTDPYAFIGFSALVTTTASLFDPVIALYVSNLDAAVNIDFYHYNFSIERYQ